MSIREEKKCSCGRKVCKDKCSSKPCYKGSDLEGIIAKQMLELVSCGCGQTVCIDECTKKPCSEKIQLNPLECQIEVKKNTEQIQKEASENEIVKNEVKRVSYNEIPDEDEIMSKRDEDEMDAVKASEDEPGEVVEDDGNVLNTMEVSIEEYNGGAINEDQNANTNEDASDVTKTIDEMGERKGGLENDSDSLSPIKSPKGSKIPVRINSAHKESEEIITVDYDQCSDEEIKRKHVNVKAKTSCGCKSAVCEDTCSFKPCQDTSCACNREVCKNTCSRKPCKSKKISSDEDTNLQEPQFKNMLEDEPQKTDDDLLEEKGEVEPQKTDDWLEEKGEDGPQRTDDDRLEQKGEVEPQKTDDDWVEQKGEVGPQKTDDDWVEQKGEVGPQKTNDDLLEQKRKTNNDWLEQKGKTDDCVCVGPQLNKKQEQQKDSELIQRKLVKPPSKSKENVVKDKKQSCGCNKKECKDTCKYKPCKNATCGCNKEVCKDYCKMKPCYKKGDQSSEIPIKTNSNVIKNNSQAINDEEIPFKNNSQVVNNEKNNSQVLNNAKNSSQANNADPTCGCTKLVCIETCEFKPCVKTCGCNREVCKDYCEKKPCIKPGDTTTKPVETSAKRKCTAAECKPTCPSKPCNPQINDCGCGLEACKETCSQKPCKSERAKITELPRYVKNLIGEISCLCNKPQIGQKFVKNESQYKPTVSALKVGVEALQDKCRNKDIIIDCLRKEIANHPGSNVFSDMLGHVAQYKGARDFDRLMVARELPVPECYKSEGVCGCTPGGFDGCCKTDPAPLEIVDVKRIGGRCILVKWLEAGSKEIVGYEVCMKGVVVTRVLDRGKTSAVLAWDTGLNGESVEIRVYAFTEKGRCFPPAVAEYKTVVDK